MCVMVDAIIYHVRERFRPRGCVRKEKKGKGFMLNLFLSVLLKYFIFKCLEYRNIGFACFSALYLIFYFCFCYEYKSNDIR